jgi:uncharacterized integral membrane protein
MDNTKKVSKKNFILDIINKSFIFLFVFILFIINFTAVAISLQCNRYESLPFKIVSSVFAFMFGFLYIIINYFMYRVNLKKDPCMICIDNIFPLFDRSYE